MVVPTREDVRRARAAMKTAADYDYFFDRISSPEWIEPLLEEGLLKEPPSARRESDGIWFPPWAGSRFLARMAGKSPHQVCRAIEAIPDTDNVSVHEDYVDAALAMPAEVAARLVPKAKHWIQSGPLFAVPQKLGQLVIQLARGGQVDSAFILAEDLLALRSKDRLALADENGLAYTPEPEPLFDTWDYGEILKTVLPSLADIAGERTLLLATALLDEALRIASALEENPSTTTEDLSYIWRPAIEDHEQNWSGDAKDSLVVGVRNVLSVLIDKDPTFTGTLVRDLLSKRRRVYHRLALYLLDAYGEHAQEVVQEALADPELIDELGVRHEFGLLMKHRFASMPPDVQMDIIRVVTEGFDEEEFRTRYEAARGSQPSDEEIREYEAYRRRDGLRLIGREALPREQQEELDRLIAQLGEPDHPPEDVSFSTSWVGPTSPMETNDIASMDVDELVDYLRTWEPSGGHMAPTPEGLSRVLSAVVTENPQQYASQATRFAEVDPTYVRGLLSGLRESLKQRKTFEWSAVLDLCVWVVSQPRDIPGRTAEYMDLDPGWVWARKAIGDLLSDALAKDAPGPAFELREKVWAAIEPLTNDPEPDVEYESRYGGDNMDPATLSINTVRGEAMHAVISYLVWTRRHVVDQRGEESFSLGEAPEGLRVLETHLLIENDPSLAVRSVYGWHFPRLFLLDRGWTTAAAERIFPTAPGSEQHFDAAWGAYVLFNAPITEVVDVLMNAYEVAISTLDRPTEGRRLHRPEERLASHLMTLYWQGHQDFRDAEGLIHRFFDNAPVRFRAHAHAFIGRSLREASRIPLEIENRLKNLWEWRVERADGDEEAAKELVPFGWWFASGAFEAEWSLDQLGVVLGRAKGIDPRHLVAERLVALAEAHPYEVVGCLRLFIETAEKVWEVYGIREEAESILRKALASGNKRAEDLASVVVHSLGARGFREFRPLLEGPAPRGKGLRNGG